MRGLSGKVVVVAGGAWVGRLVEQAAGSGARGGRGVSSLRV